MAIRYLDDEVPELADPVRRIRYLDEVQEVIPVAEPTVKPLAGEGVFPEETLTGTEKALGALSIVPGFTLPLAIAGLVNPQITRARDLQLGATAEGALSTITAGLSDAIARRAGVPTVGREAARTLAPEAMSLGEIAGVAVPLGQIAKAPQTVRGITGASARVGGTLGTAGGIASAIPEPAEAIDPLNVALRGTIGGGVGTVVGAVGGGGLARLQMRGLTTPVVEKATGLLRGLDEVKLGEVVSKAPPRIVEAAGKTNLTGAEAVQFGKKAQAAAFDEAKGFLEAAEKGGYAMKGDDLIEGGRAAILRTFESLNDNPEAVATILNNFSQLKGQISPVRGQRFLRELNVNYDRLVDKASPESFAYRSIRDGLADQLDDIVKLSSGKDIQPYRDYGNIGEFIGGISSRLDEARQTAGSIAVPTSPDSALSGARTLTGQVAGAISRTAQRFARPLVKQGKEFVDNAVEDVIKGSPKKVSRQALAKEAIEKLRQTYLKRTEPPPIPQTAPTLDDQISALIQTYPREIQSQPSLAQALARQELGVGRAPANP